jgi:hypothetical protein
VLFALARLDLRCRQSAWNLQQKKSHPKKMPSIRIYL